MTDVEQAPREVVQVGSVVIDKHRTAEISPELRAGAFVYRMGGQITAAAQVPNCNTCASDYRGMIENAVLFWGFKPGAIHRHLDESYPGHGLSEDSIRRHFNRGHVPIDEAVKNSVLQQSDSTRIIDLTSVGINFQQGLKMLAANAMRDILTGRLKIEKVADLVTLLQLDDYVAELRSEVAATAQGDVIMNRFKAIVVASYDAIARGEIEPEQATRWVRHQMTTNVDTQKAVGYAALPASTLDVASYQHRLDEVAPEEPGEKGEQIELAQVRRGVDSAPAIDSATASSVYILEVSEEAPAVPSAAHRPVREDI